MLCKDLFLISNTVLTLFMCSILQGCRFEDADDTILLFIELQAAVQVFIQRLALLFDPENPQKMHPIIRVVDSINLILADTTTGGGACRGHSHALLLHLLKNLKHNKFFLLLTEKYDSMCKGICSFDETYAQMKVPPKHLMFSLYILMLSFIPVELYFTTTGYFIFLS